MGIFHGPHGPPSPSSLSPPPGNQLGSTSLSSACDWPRAPPCGCGELQATGGMTLSVPELEKAEDSGFGVEGSKGRGLRYPQLTAYSVRLPCSYYLKESKGSRRWLLFLEGRVWGLRCGAGGVLRTRNRAQCLCLQAAGIASTERTATPDTAPCGVS